MRRQTTKWRSTFVESEEIGEGIAYKKAVVHTDKEEFNRFVLSVLHSRGRRVRIRIPFEVWTVNKGKYQYRRLRGEHAVLLVDSPEEAQAAIECVHGILSQLQGRHLVSHSETPRQSDPPPGTK